VRFSAHHKHSLYLEFAKLLDAGFPVEATLKTLDEQPLPTPCKYFVKSMAAGIESGKGIAESVRGINEIEISGVEHNLIEAGERGGGLADVFEHLSDYFLRLHNSRRTILGKLIYPFLLFHLALGVGTLMRGLSHGNGWATWWPTLLALIIFYAIIAAAFFAHRTVQTGSAGAQTIDAAIRRIPLFGSLRKALSMERFCHVFKIYIVTAFKPSDGLKAAGEASQSAQLQRSAITLSAQVADGQRLGPLLHADSNFSKSFASSIATAEEAGMLDKDLKRWTKYYAGQTEQLLQRAETWIPRLVYGVIVVFVAWQIIQAFSNYFEMVTAPLNGI